MNWELRQEIDKELSPIQSIFKNRGLNYTKEEIIRYLNPTANEILDVALIEHLRDGAEMLMKHVRADDKVLLVVDEDCDGYTSAAFFLNYFNKLFPSFVQNNIRYVVHPNKAHGIPIELIKDEKLIIVPDASSNEFALHEVLYHKGVDVLVIDHHEAPKFSEFACVINNQVGNYPNKTLSGVGMVYKFCTFFDKLMNTHHCGDLMDLVALGLVGDMMDLRNLETRYLVKTGFEKILNPFLQAMVLKQEYLIKGELNPHRAAFYIVPGINAITRIGTVEEKLILFESMLEYKAYEMIPSTKRGAKGTMESRVEQSVRNCTNIKNRQDKLKIEMSEKIDKVIQEKNLLNNKLLVIKVKEPINTGLTGLVANQVANKYKRPTLILNRRQKDNGPVTYEGSGRNFANSPITDFRQFLEDTQLIMYAQGHSSAFGFGITEENFNKFIETTNSKLENLDFSCKYDVDLVWENSEVSNFDIIDIAECENIWGQGIEEPLVLIKNVTVTKDNLWLFKEKVLKIENPQGLTFVNLSSNTEEYENL